MHAANFSRVRVSRLGAVLSFVAGAFFVSACSSGPDSGDACSKDVDCPGDLLCVDQTCVSPRNGDTGFADGRACVPRRAREACRAAGMPCRNGVEVDRKCRNGTRIVDCKQFIDFETSESHCGGCNQKCEAGEHGRGLCRSGVCTIECDAGWVDRDGDPSNGCECRTREQCGNGEDDDCDGVVDENCACQFKDKGMGVCAGQSSSSDATCRRPPAYQKRESNCGDGLDNDCDGKVDCADPDCTGWECRGEGTSCKAGDSVCHEVACNDGSDNDGSDGADCRDPDCEGQTCNASEDVGCPAPSAYEPDGEASCGDGIDNDCDGKIDCEDPDCGTSVACGTGIGAACLSKSCIERNCGDEIDNDRDGETDECADRTTCVDGTCHETDCGDGVDNDADGQVDVCASGATCFSESCVERNCVDEIDNDGDGSVDECESGAICGDETCVERNCGDDVDNDFDGTTDECESGATCKSGTCAESNCSDGIDNDHDGRADCADPDCATGAACGTGSGAGCLDGTCVETDCGDGTNNDEDSETDECAGGATCEDGTCTERNCSDDLDNDVDGTVDECPSGSGCGNGGSCQERNCGDDVDNDLDGTVDECPAGSTCSSGTCTESSCDDDVDNDADGLADCTDPDCSCAVTGALTQGDPGRWDNGTFADSCQAYQYPNQGGTATEDGWYEIKPHSDKSSFVVYCDLTTTVDGKEGGWTALSPDGVGAKFGHSLEDLAKVRGSNPDDCIFYSDDGGQPGIRDEDGPHSDDSNDDCRYDVDLGFPIDQLRLSSVEIESTARNSGNTTDLVEVSGGWSDGAFCDSNGGDFWFGVPAAGEPVIRLGALKTDKTCLSDNLFQLDPGEVLVVDGETATTDADTTLRLQFGETGGQIEGWKWKSGRIYVRDASAIP